MTKESDPVYYLPSSADKAGNDVPGATKGPPQAQIPSASGPVKPSVPSGGVQKAVDRYRDAYRAAKLLNVLGFVTRIVGILLGIMAALFVAGSIAGIGSRSNQIPLLIVVIGGGITAFLVVAFPAWVLGFMISSQAQVLKATLDGAVHTSPFLNNGQKAEVMSLK
jgi:hypothetical protein